MSSDARVSMTVRYPAMTGSSSVTAAVVSTAVVAGTVTAAVVSGGCVSAVEVVAAIVVDALDVAPPSDELQPANASRANAVVDATRVERRIDGD